MIFDLALGRNVFGMIRNGTFTCIFGDKMEKWLYLGCWSVMDFIIFVLSKVLDWLNNKNGLSFDISLSLCAIWIRGRHRWWMWIAFLVPLLVVTSYLWFCHAFGMKCGLFTIEISAFLVILIFMDFLFGSLSCGGNVFEMVESWDFYLHCCECSCTDFVIFALLKVLDWWSQEE